MEILEGENVLHDDYPVHFDYAYIIDGVPKTSPLNALVKDLKSHYDASEIRNFKMFSERDWFCK